MSTIDEITDHRYREREEPTVTHTLVKYETFAGYPSTEYDRNTSDLKSASEAISDVVTPDFSRKIKSGVIINNPCRYGKDKHQEGAGSYLAVRPADNYMFHTEGGSITAYQRQLTGVGHLTIPSLSAEAVAELVRVAKLKALAHVDETPYAFGEDVGEIKETLKFLRKPFEGLLILGRRFERDVLKSYGNPVIRRGRRRASKHPLVTAKEIAAVWTEYRFAAAPLLRSAMDALEASTFYDGTNPPERKTARGVAEESSTDSDVYRHNFSSTVYDEYLRAAEKKVDVRAGILYSVSNPVEDMQWRLGLRMKDIPHTVWQLLPYSFMVDRIVDISGAIQGLVNLLDPSVKVLAGWVVTRTTESQGIKYNSQTIPGWSIAVAGDTNVDESFTYERETWDPSVLDVIPNLNEFGLTEDVTKTADLIALVLQAWSFPISNKS